MRLLNETPITTPRLRHRINVLVITAWSSWVLVASTATDVAGKERPWPTLAGTRKIVASHTGIPSHISERAIPPTSILSDPITMSHCIRPVAVMMNPADTPHFPLLRPETLFFSLFSHLLPWNTLSLFGHPSESRGPTLRGILHVLSFYLPIAYAQPPRLTNFTHPTTTVIDAYNRSLRITFISTIAIFIVVNALVFVIKLPNLKRKQPEEEEEVAEQ
jgi:hypothetical protein